MSINLNRPDLRRRPKRSRTHTQNLNPDDLCRGASYVEDAGRKGAPCTTNTVYRNRSHRVVHLDLVEKEDGEDHDDACDRPEGQITATSFRSGFAGPYFKSRASGCSQGRKTL